MTVKGFSKASFFHIVELLRRMSHKSESPHETEKDRTLRMLDGNIVLCSVKDKEPEAEQAPQRIRGACRQKSTSGREIMKTDQLESQWPRCSNR
jgi:hypothetical protein